MFSEKKNERSLRSVSVDPAAARQRRAEQMLKLRKQEQLAMNKRRGLDTDEQTKPTAIDIEKEIRALPEIREGIMSDDPEVKLEAIIRLRKLLSASLTPPIGRVLQLNVVDELIRVMQPGFPDQFRLEAAWALTNIASGSCDQTSQVVEAGAIESFVELLKDGNAALCEQAVWGLGNIAGDMHQFRDRILELGGMSLILDQLNAPNPSENMIHTVTWTISNLCRGKRPPPDFSIVSQALPHLRQLILSSDPDVQADACWALSYLSDDTTENKSEPSRKIQRVLEAGVVPRLIELMSSPKLSVKTPALRTIGNLVTGTNEQTQIVLNHNVLPALGHLLQGGAPNIRQEACWAISNITAGNKMQIDRVASANLFQHLVAHMEGPYKDIQKEAAWAVANACYGGTSEHIAKLVEFGVIPRILDMLRDPDDERVTQILIEALRLILTAGIQEGRRLNRPNPYAVDVHRAHGAGVLQSLMEHPSTLIKKRAYEVAHKFFEVEETTDEGAEDETGEVNF